MLLGVPKAVLSNLATWIGVSLEIARSEVRVEVTEAEVTELLQLIHTLFGKCMSIASVLYIWRPLLQELYAALHGPNKAPNNCIWTKQVRHTLLWLQALLRGESGSIRRVYSVDQYYNTGVRVQITWDASPHGMGAFLTINGCICEPCVNRQRRCPRHQDWRM